MPTTEHIQVYRYAWGNNPKRKALQGRLCRILVAGTKNSVLVEFLDDSSQEVVSRRALRKENDMATIIFTAIPPDTRESLLDDLRAKRQEYGLAEAIELYHPGALDGRQVIEAIWLGADEQKAKANEFLAEMRKHCHVRIIVSRL